MGNDGLSSIRNNAALRQIYRRHKIFSFQKTANIAVKDTLSRRKEKKALRHRRHKLLFELILLGGVATFLAILFLHGYSLLS